MAAPDIQFNPFDYKAITFLELMAQLEANPLFQNKPQWLKVLFAGRTDIHTSYIDARANDNFLHSMYTLENAWNRSRTLVFSTEGNVGGEPVYYSSPIDVNFTGLTQNINVTEGRFYTDTPAVTFTGEAFEEFKIDRPNIIKGQVSLVITATTWTEVTDLVDSQPTDKHYRIILKDDGAYIRGGDGTEYGSVFPAGFTPEIMALYGGGTRGNQSAGKVTNYIGASIYIESVTNNAAMSGGQGAESLDEIKTYAPLGVVAQNRAVSDPDFLFFSETFPGLSRAITEPNKFGPGSTKVQVVPNGGGDPTSLIKNDLATFLKEKTLLSNIFIEVGNPVYQPVDVQIEIELGAAVDFVDVEDYMNLGVYFLLHETTKELKAIRQSEGVESLITTVNTYFGFTFDPLDTTVQKNITTLLDTAEVTIWGRDIFQNIFFTMADKIAGIDFIDLIEPGDTVDIASPLAPIAIPTTGSIIVTPRNKPERSVEEIIEFISEFRQDVLSDNDYSDTIEFTEFIDAEVF
jgi:hypothetical protein